MFDKKIEPVAQKVVRARLMLDEAQANYEKACDEIKALIPEGARYVTKDGETITHAKGAVRRSPVVEALRGYLKGSRLRIWRAIRIDAVDMKKLNGYIDAGELGLLDLVDAGCIEETVCKSSVRLNFPSTKSLVA
jgi:hypothetical protein